MGDRNVKEKGNPVQGETKIRSLTILGASLRNGLHTSLTKERDEELEEDGMARGDRTALQILADHEMIRQELITTGAEGVGGGGRRGQTEAEPRCKPEVIVGEHELWPRGSGGKPAGGPSLP